MERGVKIPIHQNSTQIRHIGTNPHNYQLMVQKVSGCELNSHIDEHLQPEVLKP